MISFVRQAIFAIAGCYIGWQIGQLSADVAFPWVEPQYLWPF